MAIRGITFSKQSVASNDDAHIYKVLLNGRNGKTKGCEMTFGTDEIYISNGYFMASSRLIEVSSVETITTPIVTSGTNYCRLVFEIDLTKINTNSEFNQGAFKILSSSTDYPQITQEDLENGGNVYQLPFAKFTKTITGIENFISELQSIGHVAGNTTIYVSPTGNDASGDGSQSLPFKTIKHALDSIPRDLGDNEITIDIASGTYAEDVVISGFCGSPLRISVGAVTVNQLSIYDSCVIINGDTLTISASGKTYGLYCHRDSNVICQSKLTINGATNGIYAGYASRLNIRGALTINSCTFAITTTFAAIAYISTVTGSRNNNGVQASGGIVTIGSIVAEMASTLYVTSNGGRIFTGSQSSVPSY